jgi:hypothetical protein
MTFALDTGRAYNNKLLFICGSNTNDKIIYLSIYTYRFFLVIPSYIIYNDLPININSVLRFYSVFNSLKFINYVVVKC